MIVRTVQGDVAPEELGLTLGHEHLIARPPAFVEDEDLRLNEEHAAIRELRSFRDAGGGALVEMTTVDYGRDAEALARVAAGAEVHVIAATGFNKGRFADPIVARHTDEELVAWMIAEVRSGAAPYVPPDRVVLTRDAEGDRQGAVRAGLIKASTGAAGPGAQERRVLEAAARAQRATGAPIGTHTERAAWALEQAEFFDREGVEPEKVLIGHCDFRPDLAYLLEVASTGVRLGFDQFSKSKYLPDETRVALLTQLASEGRLEQVIVSGDLARRSYWPAYGGAEAPGLAHVPRTVVPMLRAEGWRDADVDVLLRENPRRWLAFVPR